MMACEYNWQGTTVVKTFTGFVTGTDFVQSAEAVSADPRFDDVKFIINDFLRIGGHSINRESYFAVAASRVGAARTNPNFRVIFIANQQVLDELHAAVASAVMSTHFDPWFCSSRQEASQWIMEQPSRSDSRLRRP